MGFVRPCVVCVFVSRGMAGDGVGGGGVGGVSGAGRGGVGDARR